ncbi:MAG: alpha-galactosidase [Anaerolineaceae bacterium]|nr:alpha-galactosidase [Anaerolineaceae bacterium]
MEELSHTWQCVFDAQTASLRHLSAPVSFEIFTLYLTYTCDQRRLTDHLQFEAVREACDQQVSVFHAQHPGFTVEACCEHDDPLRIRLALTNTAALPIALDRLDLHIEHAKLGGHGQPLHFFKNGFQSWSETHSFRRDEREIRPIARFLEVSQTNLRNRASNQVGHFSSEMYTLITNPLHKQTILIGQAGNFDQFLNLRVNFEAGELLSSPPDLHLAWDFGGQQLAPRKKIELDEVRVYVGEDETELLSRYMSGIQPPIRERRPLPGGWCSWYYYFHKVTNADILENISEAARHQPEWDIFVLDDGYQAAVGDWLKLNRKFPMGLKLIAEAVHEIGLRPGIWTAPFIARPNAQIVRDHPDWFLRHPKRDKPLYAGWNPGWGGNYYALDVTHPGVQDYLRTVFQTFAHEFGFEFFKLDFTFAASLVGRAHDPELSAAQRLRLGYQLVRDAVGEDALILGCGSPLSPAIGVLDAMRIGPDVAPYWSDWFRSILTRDAHALSTRNAIRSILNRAPMHRKLWVNDPDCLMLRDKDTKLSHAERFSLINAAVITGGMSIFSDRLSRLSDRHWDDIHRIVELSRECDQGEAIVLDLMLREMPELVYNTRGYLAVFNFSDESVDKNIPYLRLERVLETGSELVDVWDGLSFRTSAQGLHLGLMPPHSSRLLKIIGAGQNK